MDPKTHKRCQTCKVLHPISKYEKWTFQGREYTRATCSPWCLKKYDARRARRRAKPEHKAYHAQDREGATFKANKKKQARKYNASEKGKATKRKSDKKFRSTVHGMITHRVSSRFGKLAKGETKMSKTVLKHTAFASKDSIDQWLRRHVPDDVTDVASYLKDKTIDHTIPCNAFTFKIEDGSVIRCFDVSIEDQKRLWDPDNMTLMDALEK